MALDNEEPDKVVVTKSGKRKIVNQQLLVLQPKEKDDVPELDESDPQFLHESRYWNGNID